MKPGARLGTSRRAKSRTTVIDRPQLDRSMIPKLFTTLDPANKYALLHFAQGYRVAIERGYKGRQPIYIVHAWRQP
jgi:hypothetical protein